MNLTQLLASSADRHLSEAERLALMDWSRTIELTSRIAGAAQAAENEVVGAVTCTLQERFPRFGEMQPDAWDRLSADMRLVLRHDVCALLLGDPRGLEADER
jgi:hypothetical protein